MQVLANAIRTALLTAIIVSGVGGAAVAEPVEDAFAAAQRGDFETALRLWRPLADQGDADAQFNLGIMYDNGRGVDEKYAEAVRWYRKAADQGYTKAQFNFGIMYDNGEGVPENDVQAYKWWNLAAAQGNETAKENKAIIEKTMTREQIAEAQRLSTEWKPVEKRD